MHMHRFKNYSRYLTWLTALVLGTLVAGCHGSGGGSGGSGGGAGTPVAADTTQPTLTFTAPADGAANVVTNTQISASFSEDMDPATITDTTFTLTDGVTFVVGTVTYDVGSRTAVFTPTTPAPLAATTPYTATITTGATDLAGNTLSAGSIPNPWIFTTGATTDTTPPTVTSTNPADMDPAAQCLQQSVNASFNEDMDPITFTTTTFTLQVTGPPLGPVLGATVTYDAPSRVATLNPSSDLLANTNYTATITTGVEDLAGNALAADVVLTFDTGTQDCLSPVALGAAAPLGTMGGGAGMTNQGTLTVINGDIATAATAPTAVTGFHDTAGDVYTETLANIGSVNGLIYTCTVSTTGPTSAAVNPAACSIGQQAAADAQTAFDDLAALPAGSDPGAGSLNGLVLAPGVYTAAGGSFLIQGGDLTLDAEGDANAVWVFQMATTLTVGGPGAAFPQSVILINGAQAKNVFWQVGSAATINAAGGGTMVGTIISSAGTSFSTAGNLTVVTLNGRALALNASVTLVNTVINVPAP
jgi:hypothetical protein